MTDVLRLLVTTCSLTLLAACGTSTSSDTAEVSASPASPSPAVARAGGVGPTRQFEAGNLVFAVPRSWPDGISMARSISRHLGPPDQPQGGDLASQAASGYGLALSRRNSIPAGSADGVAVQLPAKLLDSSDVAWPAGAWAAEAQADNGVVPVVLTVVAPDRVTAEAVAASLRSAED